MNDKWDSGAWRVYKQREDCPACFGDHVMWMGLLEARFLLLWVVIGFQDVIATKKSISLDLAGSWAWSREVLKGKQCQQQS